MKTTNFLRAFTSALLVCALLLLMPVFALAEDSGTSNPVDSILDALDDQQIRAAYDHLAAGETFKAGDKSDAAKGLQQALKLSGLSITVDGDIGNGTMSAVNELAKLIADPAVTALPVEEVDVQLFEELMFYALNVQDNTTASLLMFGLDDMFNRISYYSAARLVLEDGNKAGAVILYEQIAPYRNTEALIAEFK